MQQSLHRSRVTRLVAACVATAAFAACSDAPTSTDEEGARGALRFVVVSGSEQSALPGHELPAPLVVRVTNAAGVPVPQRVVNFRVTQGGGSVFAGAAATDNQGIAREWWTLGANPGPNTLEVRAVDPETGEKRVYATFTATAVDPTRVASTVTVTPTTASLQAGGSTALTAVARNSAGDVIIGRPFAWTSSNPIVASVDSAGTVRGLAAGSATITATLDARSASATVTVTVPPPPTGNAIFSENFESGSFGVWDDGYDPGLHRIVTDPALAHTGSRVLEMRYARGTTGAGFLTKFFMPGYDSVRVSYWARFPANWQGGTYLVGLYGNRIDQQWSGFGKAGVCPNGRDFFINFLYADYAGSPGDTRMYQYHPEAPRSGTSCWGDVGTTTGAQYFPPTAMSRDAWHRIELVVRANTPGQRNGRVRYFIDGVLKGDWQNLRQRDTDSLRINALQLTGQVSIAGGVPQDQVLYIDDVEVTGGNVGSPPASVVTSVQVTPSTATLPVGGTASLSAQARDAAGAVMAGQSFAWATSNAAVATVSANGTVTAVAPGTATIRASVGSVFGSATVTVTQVPPTTPGGFFANEPTGMTRISDYGFDQLNGPWSYIASRAYAHVVSDPSAPVSPGSVLEFAFPRGFTGGGYAPATSYAPRLGTNRRELYWAFSWKANPEWQNHQSNINKFGYGWLNNSLLWGLTWHWGRPVVDGRPVPQVMSLFEGGRYWHVNLPAATALPPGVWHHTEVYFRPSSAPGVADGIVRIWNNGALHANHVNIVTSSGAFTEVYFSPTWGGAGTYPKQQDDYLRFDHVRLSVR